ncbi:hypothetical protein [Verrucomicrobium spinosum]|uniref:hypothetical protein n=1 Tax=Verrucomicrobium spinosum TaxID=2736 RepID=UPI0001745AC5|nr:hypothetical protein [Verrucomicrobium spinosum]
MRLIILIVVLTPFLSLWGSQKDEVLRLSILVDESSLEQPNSEHSTALAKLVVELISNGTPEDIKATLASVRLDKPSGQIIATESILAFRESDNAERLASAVTGSANWSRSISDELPRGKTTIERFRLRVGRQLLRKLELDDSDSASLTLLVKDVSKWLQITLEQASKQSTPEKLELIERVKASITGVEQIAKDAGQPQSPVNAGAQPEERSSGIGSSKLGWWAVFTVTAVGIILILTAIVRKKGKRNSS